MRSNTLYQFVPASGKIVYYDGIENATKACMNKGGIVNVYVLRTLSPWRWFQTAILGHKYRIADYKLLRSEVITTTKEGI